MNIGHTTVDMTPIGDKVLVEIEEQPLSGGLVRPDGARSAIHEIGLVVAAGPGRQLDDGTWLPGQVKVGDRIMFVFHAPTGPGSAFQCSEVKLGNAKYYLVPPVAITGVLGAGAQVSTHGAPPVSRLVS